MNENFIINRPSQILGGTIAVYENVWEDLEKDIAFFNSISFDSKSDIFFSKAKVDSEDSSDNPEVKDIRTGSSLSLTKAAIHSDVLNNVNNKFIDILSKSLTNYKSMFQIEQPLFYTEDNNLLQYTETQKFNSHYDGDSSSKRMISPILYLNDDYIGGEIEFVNFGIKIKPKPGSLIVFPSNYAYRHIAHPVTSGTKYAIVTWVHDRKNGP
jgi:predicted 2-oxoglutarate/Fe(II)-dependent dioxygenase YbiX